MTIKFDPGNMTIEWDERARAAYITLSKNKVARTREVADNLHVDVDSRGGIVGIEWLAPAGTKLPAVFTRRINTLSRQYRVPELKKAPKALKGLVAA